MTALFFVPLFIGLSVALTVIVADMISPENSAAAADAKKSQQKRPVAAA